MNATSSTFQVHELSTKQKEQEEGLRVICLYLRWQRSKANDVKMCFVGGNSYEGTETERNIEFQLYCIDYFKNIFY